MIQNTKLDFEVRNCHTVGEYGQRLRERSESHKFLLDDFVMTDNKYLTDSLPIDLEPEATYIITSWNSNTICKAIGNKSFEVIEHYGEQLQIGKDYMLILPCY